MTEYDTRQLKLMINELDAFERKAIDLTHLVSTLDGLLSALEDVDTHWKNFVLKQWGVLEDVNADILDKSLTEIPNQHLSLIANAIQEIRSLISQRL